MGTFSVKATIANPDAVERRSTIELLVDTGALFSFLPEQFLRELGILPHRRKDFVTINGTVIQRSIGRAMFVIEGEEEVTAVVFAEGGDLHVLGALTLEALGFVVDPQARKLTLRQTFPAAHTDKVDTLSRTGPGLWI